MVIVTGLTCFAGFTAIMARIALGINGVGDEVELAVRDIVSKDDLNQSVGGYAFSAFSCFQILEIGVPASLG